ncbi:MAG: HDIG domain-containing metalloprotein [Candidatus Lokiarchaeia archaeon]
MIPSKKRCLEILKTYNVPRNIVNHSMVVSRLAVFLARELNKKGFNLDINKIEAAALLHDIKKMDGLIKGTSHAHEGWRLLRKIGYSNIADIVKQHVVLEENDDSSKILEAELVNYSDKRVRHSRIVTLRERFEDLKKRYGRDEEAIEFINILEQKTFEIETKIFSNLDFEPEEIPKLIKIRH